MVSVRGQGASVRQGDQRLLGALKNISFNSKKDFLFGGMWTEDLVRNCDCSQFRVISCSASVAVLPTVIINQTHLFSSRSTCVEYRTSWQILKREACYSCATHIHVKCELSAARNLMFKYSHLPHNDVLVNDGPHIPRWSHDYNGAEKSLLPSEVVVVVTM